MRVIDFAVVMLNKLEENDAKQGWGNLTHKWLLNRARQEMREVERAIAKKKTPKEVARECADVANFLLMVADNYENCYEEPCG